ncbi:MAG: sugar phosphate isomerase/epimerase [Chloroflexota bacterium]|nr:sugar phosphate isomerase/epimerase [Chloroflexota bacterium]
MKLAFSAPDRGPDERSELLRGFRAAGFEGLQLKRPQYQTYLDDPSRFTAEWGSIPGVSSGLITGGDLGDDAVSDLRRVIAFAEAVSGERIVYCHGVPRASVDDDDIRRFSRILLELGKEALARGVQLSLHHHYNQPVMYRHDFDVFFAEIPDRQVTLTVDTAHLVKSGVSDVPALIRDLAPFVDNFHVKDIADAVFVPLGDGEIDFAPIFSAIVEIGYDGWLCADEESGAAIGEAMGASHRFLSTLLTPIAEGVS